MIRNLQRRNARRREAEAVIEGVRLVEEALAADDVTFHGSVVSPALTVTERGAALVRLLTAAGATPEQVSEEELAALADTVTPQGVLAVVTPPSWRLNDIVPRAGAPALVLDGIQDPGNVGTLVRTAFGLNGCGVIALPGTALLTHPKVMRAGMGAGFRMPVVRADDDELRRWLDDTKATLVALEAGAAPLSGPLEGAVAVMVGNEGAGMRDKWKEVADIVCSIPMADAAESLNVAVAAGIALYEVRRGT